MYQFRYYGLKLSFSLLVRTFANYSTAGPIVPYCTVVLSVEVVYFITSRCKVESLGEQDRLNSHPG